MPGCFIRTNRILEILENRGIRKDIKKFRYALEKIGSPHKKFKSVLIGGTNGKGSVVFLTSYIIKNSGYKVGSYISPHIFDVRERIMLNLRKIGYDDFNELCKNLFYFFEKKNIKLTYFEFLTAVAFRYFYEKKVDIAIVEVGMGGRWDATNVLEPLVSVITTIQFDHIQVLGSTLEKIAYEKSGILRPYGIAVFGEVVQNLIEIAEKLKNSYFKINSDFFCSIDKESIKVYSLLGIYDAARLNPDIAYAKNVAISFALCDVLKILSFKLKDYKINPKIPGRFQTLKVKDKKIILDVAHNPDAIKNLVNVFKEEKPVVVFSCMKDKDYKTMLRLLKKSGFEVYFYELPYERALKFKYIRSYNIKRMEDLSDIFILNKKNILITGSHYLLGKFIEKLKVYDAAY